MPADGTYSVEAVRALDTHRTPIQKQPEMLMCMVRICHRYYLGDEVYRANCYLLIAKIDLFNLIRAPNPTKVKTGSRPRAPHEVPLLTLTATWVIEMDEPAVATDSFGVPSTIERSPLDFAHEAEASDRGTAAPEMPPPKDVPATAAPGAGQAEETATTEPHVAREIRSSHGGKSLAAIQLGLASNVFVPEGAPADVSDPDPLSFADAPSRHLVDVVHLPKVLLQQETRSLRMFFPLPKLGLLEVYTGQNEVLPMVAYLTPLRHAKTWWTMPHLRVIFFELRHMHNEWFLRQYNVNLARQVAMGSQLRIRFEQEAKLLRKSVAQEARRDKRIQAQEPEIKNLEALLEAEADMKKAAEGKSAGLIQELEDMRAWFSDLQVSNEHLSQQVATLQKQVSGEEKLKAAFEEFKQYEDDRVERRCAELDQLEGLKDAPMDVIMSALYLKSDTGGDAPQYICDLRPSSSQLTILVSDSIPVSVPTVVPQGLALLLVDAAT
nr:hypothetical protein [Tanacetum cinerariifolium]